MLLGVVVVALQTVVDGLVHLGGDTHLLFARWTDAVASEEHDDAVGGIDGFADKEVLNMEDTISGSMSQLGFSSMTINEDSRFPLGI